MRESGFRIALRALCFALAAAAWISAAAAAVSPLEASIKATFLVKFAGFVEWPAATFASPVSPIRLCIVGDDPFGDLVDRAAAGEAVAGHPIAIHRLATPAEAKNCHIVYLGGGAVEAAPLLRGAPVLTVSDVPPAAGVKGIINFVVQNNRVRFEIDDRAARQDGLRISSKLLELAVAARSGGGR
jgi:hypothetical protein